jgi:tetratricopeptide (TPR) repeat protein
MASPVELDHRDLTSTSRQARGARDDPYLVRNAATKIPLHLSIDAGEDWLIALEFGAVLDWNPPEERVALSENFAFVLRELGGEVIGFAVDELSEFDPDDVGGAIWDGPRFDVPVLGLERASAGEIITVAKSTFRGLTTIDNYFFSRATNTEDLDEAEVAWRVCLAAGNLKAHFGLGYTLYDQGRYAEAYGHLRRYTELCPKNSWAWCWFGKVCAARGEVEEARRAFERAIELEERGSFETDAHELLEELAPRTGRGSSKSRG